MLVNPPSHAEWRGFRPHIGLGYIAEHLAANGVEHDVLDMNLGYGVRDLVRRIRGFQPDLVGMTLLTMEYRRFYEILRSVKEAAPGVGVVVGGPHVTIMRERVLQDCGAADYAVTHEGEHTLLELCRGVDERRIRGLVYREDGEVAYAGDRGFEMRLDSLRWPRYSRFELNRYIPEADIYSSRGCPYECVFCPNRLISPVFRARSAENVVEEISYWYDRGYRQFNFDDDNLNLIRGRVLKMCDLIEQAGLKGITLRCSNGLRADHVDREMLARMREVGFRYIAFGVDAGNDRMLKAVKKGETMADIEQAVGAATDLGYETKLLFVVGTPQETWADVEDKVALCRRYPVQDVHFYNIIPYPGTELFEWITRHGLFVKDPEEYLNDVSCMEKTPVFETPELPVAMRVQLYDYLEGVRKRIHRDAARRLCPTPVADRLLGWVASRNTFRSHFYQSFFVRRVVDRWRYATRDRRKPDHGGAEDATPAQRVC